jgi:hypothetical protein
MDVTLEVTGQVGEQDWESLHDFQRRAAQDGAALQVVMHDLQVRAQALTPIRGTRASGTGRRARTRRSGARASTATARNGARAEKALQIIAEHPGWSTVQIAQEMGIEPNYLYRALPRLAGRGRVRKDDGGGWHPAP